MVCARAGSLDEYDGGGRDRHSLVFQSVLFTVRDRALDVEEREWAFVED